MTMYKFGPDCSVKHAETGAMVSVPQGIHDVTWDGTISKVGNPSECTIHVHSEQIIIKTFRTEIIRLCEEGKAKPYP